MQASFSHNLLPLKSCARVVLFSFSLLARSLEVELASIRTKATEAEAEANLRASVAERALADAESSAARRAAAADQAAAAARESAVAAAAAAQRRAESAEASFAEATANLAAAQKQLRKTMETQSELAEAAEVRVRRRLPPSAGRCKASAAESGHLSPPAWIRP